MSRPVPHILGGRYHSVVAMNLRLSDAAAAALRAAAQRTGRSQQELLREAVEQYLGLHRDSTTREQAIQSGLVRPPAPFQDVKPGIVLPTGQSSIDLLERDHDR